MKRFTQIFSAVAIASVVLLAAPVLASHIDLEASSQLVSEVQAANPHFMNTSASFVGSGPNLRVSWKEAGLGDTVEINYTASANGTATYACFNRGGHNPAATNKQDINGPVTASGNFSSGKNGSINGSLTILPPSSGDFSCPSGQNLVLARVIYTNVSIRDNTNGVSEAIPGTFCRSFISQPEFAC